MKEFLLNNYKTIICVVLMIVWLIVDIISRVKGKKFETLKAVILKVMEYVENYKTPNGEPLGAEYKLAYAKSLIIQECKANKISYDDKTITEIIERMVDFSKTINYKGDKNDNDKDN